MEEEQLQIEENLMYGHKTGTKKQVRFDKPHPATCCITSNNNRARFRTDNFEKIISNR